MGRVRRWSQGLWLGYANDPQLLQDSLRVPQVLPRSPNPIAYEERCQTHTCAKAQSHPWRCEGGNTHTTQHCIVLLMFWFVGAYSFLFSLRLGLVISIPLFGMRLFFPFSLCLLSVPVLFLAFPFFPLLPVFVPLWLSCYASLLLVLFFLCWLIFWSDLWYLLTFIVLTCVVSCFLSILLLLCNIFYYLSSLFVFDFHISTCVSFISYCFFAASCFFLFYSHFTLRVSVF